MKKFTILLAASAICVASAYAQDKGAQEVKIPTVYMTRDISPEGLVKVYKALGHPATGRVAVKISTGEPGGHNYLKPELIKDLVETVDGTIVEWNTASTRLPKWT